MSVEIDALTDQKSLDLPKPVIRDRFTATDVAAKAATDQSRWYVFRSIAGQESLAENNLRFQNFTFFLPKMLATKRHARRFVVRKEWIFPRYGFVSLDVNRDRWRSVNGTYGIERLVMGPNGPQPVPTGIVEALQTYTDGRGLFDFNSGLKPGSTVRVKSGAFAGAIGTLQRLDGKERVELLLDLLNGQVRTKLARGSIEAIA